MPQWAQPSDLVSLQERSRGGDTGSQGFLFAFLRHWLHAGCPPRPLGTGRSFPTKHVLGPRPSATANRMLRLEICLFRVWLPWCHGRRRARKFNDRTSESEPEISSFLFYIYIYIYYQNFVRLIVIYLLYLFVENFKAFHVVAVFT